MIYPNDWDYITREDRIRRLRAQQRPFTVIRFNRAVTDVHGLTLLKVAVLCVLVSALALYAIFAY